MIETITIQAVSNNNLKYIKLQGMYNLNNLLSACGYNNKHNTESIVLIQY